MRPTLPATGQYREARLPAGGSAEQCGVSGRPPVIVLEVSG